MSQAPAGRAVENDVASRLEQIRLRLVERIFHAAGALGLICLPLLLWQVHDMGWHPLLRVHGVFLLIAFAAWGVRNRLSLAFKSALIVGGVAVLGLFGVHAMGTAGAGYWWCLQSSVFAATLYSTRIGLIVAALCAVALAALGYGFTNGLLAASIDAGSAMRSASTWSGFLAVVVFGSIMLLHAFNDYQEMIEKLIVEGDAQRDELAHRIGHDELTGLPHAALAADRLDVALRHARRSGAKVALLFADLDGFKAVNDTHGHAAGDHVLRHVATRLRASVRAQDTVARVGGDEFLLILTDVRDDAVAARVADAVLADAAGALQWRQQRLQVGISIGIALYPDHAPDAAGLRKRADAAMYEAKHHGPNHWRMATSMAGVGHGTC